jgi:hypothetical protein
MTQTITFCHQNREICLEATRFGVDIFIDSGYVSTLHDEVPGRSESFWLGAGVQFYLDKCVTQK